MNGLERVDLHMLTRLCLFASWQAKDAITFCRRIIRYAENGLLFYNVCNVFAILKEYDTDEGHKRLCFMKEQGKIDSLMYSLEKIKMLFESILSKM